MKRIFISMLPALAFRRMRMGYCFNQRFIRGIDIEITILHEGSIC